MTLWRTIMAAYSLSLTRRPLLTEMTTSGCLWGLGDLAAQHIESSSSSATNAPPPPTATATPTTTATATAQAAAPTEVDWKRTLRQIAYASILWGPVAHKWYHLLDSWAVSIVNSGGGSSSSTAGTNAYTKSYRLVATKLVLEMFLLHPISLLVYFSVMKCLQSSSFVSMRDSIRQHVRHEFWPTYVLEIVMWTPLDLLNFAIVPVRHQLLVCNCGCFIEAIGLSMINSKGIDSLLQQILPQSLLSPSKRRDVVANDDSNISDKKKS